MDHSRHLLIYFRLFNTVDNKLVNKQMFNKNFADYCSRTADLWYQKRPLYQLSHNHFPFKCVSYNTFEAWKYDLLIKCTTTDLMFVWKFKTVEWVWKEIFMIFYIFRVRQNGILIGGFDMKLYSYYYNNNNNNFNNSAERVPLHKDHLDGAKNWDWHFKCCWCVFEVEWERMETRRNEMMETQQVNRCNDNKKERHRQNKLIKVQRKKERKKDRYLHSSKY